MKKSFIAVIFSLAVVLCFSLGVSYFMGMFSFGRTYSQTKCLTDQVTESMEREDIAKLYKESCVAVVVETTPLAFAASKGWVSMGSGVCVAANGYQTTDGSYTASEGAYFVTNYHVVSSAVDSDFTSTYESKIYIVTDNNNTTYPSRLLWSDKSLDLAVVYCPENLGLDFIAMKDRSINCTPEEKLLFDKVFTIGTPLDLQYKNTFAKGNISNEFPQLSASSKKFYYYTSGLKYQGSSNKYALPNGVSYVETSVIDNVYEDLIMINLDITHGNSGGGCFDDKGYLIGLTTLGIDMSSTNGAAMNFAVPIYPITQILDEIIKGNEKQSSFYLDLAKLHLYGADYNMIEYAKLIAKSDTKTDPFYYIDGKLITSGEAIINFNGEGLYLMEASSVLTDLKAGCIITAIDKGKNGELHNAISTRNDLYFYLLSCKKEDRINIYFKTSPNGNESSFTVNLRELSI